MTWNHLLPAASLLLTTSLLTAPVALAEEAPSESDMHGELVMDGFEKLLPRGQIAALVEPTFVAASEAEIPDDAWILGFELDGEAFAYDLNLLNSHEVVNHGKEGSEFAAVW